MRSSRGKAPLRMTAL